MTRRANIGFDRRIDRSGLSAAAGQAAAGAPASEMRAYLWNLLDGVLSGDKVNSARGKTVTVLNHIWGEVPDGAVALRERASPELACCTTDERLALHWVMMVGTYPVSPGCRRGDGSPPCVAGSLHSCAPDTATPRHVGRALDA